MPEAERAILSALEPLYGLHEEPARHCVRSEAGGPARIVRHLGAFGSSEDEVVLPATIKKHAGNGFANTG